jgi:hypothetical protein
MVTMTVAMISVSSVTMVPVVPMMAVTMKGYGAERKPGKHRHDNPVFVMRVYRGTHRGD